MIINEIRKQITTSMKSKESEKVALLRLILGTVQQDGDESDTALDKIIRKLIKNNNITIESIIANGGTVGDLNQENILLESFLQKNMSVEDIIAFINTSGIDLSHKGKATGAVMKALKAAGAVASGNDVKYAVDKLTES